MTDYRNGEIHGWNGGERPVDTKDLVHFYFESATPCVSLGGSFDWGLTPERPDYRIVAFRVLQKHVEPPPPPKPRVMFLAVNVYDGSYATGFSTQHAAEKYARQSSGVYRKFEVKRFVEDLPK